MVNTYAGDVGRISQKRKKEEEEHKSGVQEKLGIWRGNKKFKMEER